MNPSPGEPPPGPPPGRPQGPPPGPPMGPPPGFRPERPRRRWFWFGCLPVIVLALGVLAVVVAVASQQRGAQVERSNGTVIPPNTVTTPVPDSSAVTASCAVQQGLVQRDCAIISPPDVEPGERLPVVFLLHGFSDGPVEVRTSGDWANAVVRHRFILVTPTGVAGSWNAGGCCGIAKGTGIDDVSYLGSLIGDIGRRPDVDPDRIFMAGFSNGGMMTYRFLCVGSDLLAGAASVSGSKVIDCAPKTPLPILHVHGTADDTVPYEGGAGPLAALLGSSFPPVPQMIADVVADDGCTGAPAKEAAGQLTTEEWTDCPDGARVRFVTIAGWGHTWPLGGPMNATEELLSFFGIS